MNTSNTPKGTKHTAMEDDQLEDVLKTQSEDLPNFSKKLRIDKSLNRGLSEDLVLSERNGNHTMGMQQSIINTEEIESLTPLDDVISLCDESDDEYGMGDNVSQMQCEEHVSEPHRLLGSGDENITPLKSILKQNVKKTTKSVRFSDTPSKLCMSRSIDEYISPCWQGVGCYTNEQLVHEYRYACAISKICPSDVIIEQLMNVGINYNYSAVLSLTGFKITSDMIDSIEIIFKTTTFRRLYIDLEQLELNTAYDVFNMIAYYCPVEELIVAGHKDDFTTWRMFADMIENNTYHLRTIYFRDMVLEDQVLQIIFTAINENKGITTLFFEGCELNRAPTFMLTTRLKDNFYLEELHLCYVDLYSKEADILSKYLAANSSLRVLNLSNNKIGDRGLDALVKGLLEQAQKFVGVRVLMLVSNKLTKKCASSLQTIIAHCPLIHSLNVSINNLTDHVLLIIKESLKISTTLKFFGLQSTLLSCSGLLALAQACESNTSLQQLNLKGNKAIQPDALNDLADIIHHTKLTHVDLDDTNRYSNNPQKYIEVVNKIRNLVAVNKLISEETALDRSELWAKKFSLICEPEYVPQSRVTRATSKLSTKTTRNRFQVVSVPETTVVVPSSPSHRFIVESVSPPSSSSMITTSHNVIEIGDSTTTKESELTEPTSLTQFIPSFETKSESDSSSTDISLHLSPETTMDTSNTADESQSKECMKSQENTTGSEFTSEEEIGRTTSICDTDSIIRNPVVENDISLECIAISESETKDY